jgi:plastocyanin
MVAVTRKSLSAKVHLENAPFGIGRSTTCRSSLILFVLLCVLSLTAFAHAADDIVVVEIYDKPAMFRPDHPKIKVGQTIKWVNKGETVHTVTADPSQAPDPSWVSVPTGSEDLDSGYMSPGDTFSYQFKVPGTYKYFCLTHEEEGMRAQVDVEK